MPAIDPLLTATRLLDFEAAPIADLVAGRGWQAFGEHDRIGAGGVHLHQFLDDQLVKTQLGVNDRAGDKGAIEFVIEYLPSQGAGRVGENAQFEARMRGADGR